MRLRHVKYLFSRGSGKLALDLARCLPRHRLRKIPKVITDIQRGKIRPFWAANNKGRRFGVLLVDVKLNPHGRFVQFATERNPELHGKKIAGVCYLSAKAPREERGGNHTRQLFSEAKQALIEAGYDNLLITADERMSRIYIRAGFKKIAQLPWKESETCLMLSLKKK